MTRIILCCLVLNLTLISCSKVRESAGVNRKNIDEYQVYENPPLVIPPDFNLMPPDQIRSKKIDETDKDLAKEILFGLDNNKTLEKNKYSLINSIVEETEYENTNPDIRNELNQLSGEKSSEKFSTVFEDNEDINSVIQESEEKREEYLKELDIKDKKKKKKKRFFFF